MENKPYVFVSYAHLDGATVLPCVEAMKKSGINLWFDEGIEAGSEWPEFIAQKVVGCSKFVLFISNAYLNSQNCKRELNFAISRKKDILSVFIEDVVLSPGMEMQLGTYQAIYKKRFDTDRKFIESFCAEQYFNSCRNVGVVENTPRQEQPRTVQSQYVPNNVQQTTPKVQTENKASDIKKEDFSQMFSQFFGGQVQFKKKTPEATASTSDRPKKNRFIALALLILGGVFGAHKFYLKKYVLGGIYLACEIIGLYLCSTELYYFSNVPLFMVVAPYILTAIDFILLVFTPTKKLEQKYNFRFK